MKQTVINIAHLIIFISFIVVIKYFRLNSSVNCHQMLVTHLAALDPCQTIVKPESKSKSVSQVPTKSPKVISKWGKVRIWIKAVTLCNYMDHQCNRYVTDPWPLFPIYNLWSLYIMIMYQLTVKLKACYYLLPVLLY